MIFLKCKSDPFSLHLKILQRLPLVFRIKSKHFIMSYRTLCNLILPSFPASFPLLLPQILNPSCTKLLTWNFSSSAYCFMIQCTFTCSSCCLECPHIWVLFPVLQDSALALFPLKFLIHLLLSWYSSKPVCTTFLLPVLLCCIDLFMIYFSNWSVGPLKSYPCILCTSTVLWMEKEYTSWIYLIIIFRVPPMHKKDTTLGTVMNFAGSFSS